MLRNRQLISPAISKKKEESKLTPNPSCSSTALLLNAFLCVVAPSYEAPIKKHRIPRLRLKVPLVPLFRCVPPLRAGQVDPTHLAQQSARVLQLVQTRHRVFERRHSRLFVAAVDAKGGVGRVLAGDVTGQPGVQFDVGLWVTGKQRGQGFG